MSGRRILLPGRALPARTGVASHSSSAAACLLGVSSHSPLLELLPLSLSLSLYRQPLLSPQPGNRSVIRLVKSQELSKVSKAGVSG